MIALRSTGSFRPGRTLRLPASGSPPCPPRCWRFATPSRSSLLRLPHASGGDRLHRDADDHAGKRWRWFRDDLLPSRSKSWCGVRVRVVMGAALSLPRPRSGMRVIRIERRAGDDPARFHGDGGGRLDGSSSPPAGESRDACRRGSPPAASRGARPACQWLATVIVVPLAGSPPVGAIFSYGKVQLLAIGAPATPPPAQILAGLTLHRAEEVGGLGMPERPLGDEAAEGGVGSGPAPKPPRGAASCPAPI